MADLIPRAVLDARSADGLDRDQLHGLKCWRGTDCTGPLYPAGHAFTTPAEPGAPLGWAIVACERHREAA
jgi:hypothetical protein